MRVGVIGIGYIGVHHLRNFRRLNDEGYVELVSAADVDTSKKSIVEKYGAKYYSDYREMLDKESLDIVSIAVPTRLHRDVAIEAIRRQVNILIEKPISYSLKEANEIRDESKKYNVKVMVGHIERFNPAVLRLKEIIDKGELGEVISLSSRRLGGPRIVDCGVILDLAIHDVDVMLYLTGKKIKQIYSSALTRLPEVTNEDYAVITMLLDDDVIGRVEVSRITPVKIRELDIAGTRSYARINYLDQTVRFIESFLKAGRASWKDFREFVSKFRPEERTFEIEGEEPLYLELKSFVESVSLNKPIISSIDESIYTMKVLWAAIESYKENKVISL